MRPRDSAGLRLAGARSIGWALRVAGWLALSALDRKLWPVWIDGLGALVLSLAVTGVALTRGCGRRLALAALRWPLGLSGSACAGALVALAMAGPQSLMVWCTPCSAASQLSALSLAPHVP